MTRKFYEFKPREGEETTDLYIYGSIADESSWDDDEVTSSGFADELSEIDTDLTVHINSYGGDVSAGIAIYNLLKNFSHEVTTVVDGFACSIASVIFMAGTKRIMNEASMLLIHNAWTYVQGNSNDLRKQADELEEISRLSLDIYADVSDLSEDEIKKLMDDETWITSDEALDWGFATEIIRNGAREEINEDYYLLREIEKNRALVKELDEVNAKLEEKNELKGWDAFFAK